MQRKRTIDGISSKFYFIIGKMACSNTIKNYIFKVSNVPILHFLLIIIVEYTSYVWELWEKQLIVVDTGRQQKASYY